MVGKSWSYANDRRVIELAKASNEKMANKKWTWTAEDNERLKALAATNVSAIRAAAALKRSTTSVRAQARKIGTPFPHMKDYRKQFQDSPESSRQRY